jgi:hypothetical protein
MIARLIDVMILDVPAGAVDVTNSLYLSLGLQCYYMTEAQRGSNFLLLSRGLHVLGGRHNSVWLQAWLAGHHQNGGRDAPRSRCKHGLVILIDPIFCIF